MNTIARETEYVAWPSWATGPNGEQEVFNSEGEVPDGWEHHGKVKGGKASTAAKAATPAKTPATAPAVTNQTDGAEVDAAGVAWNADLHAATKTKTQAGLWRMKVGVARPEGQSQPLDL